MKITDQQLGRFLDMVRDFAMRNGLTAEVETGLGMEKSDVRLSSNYRCKSYRVVWKEVRSLTDAGTKIFADAMNVFGLTKDESFEIKEVIFSNPATIVLWADGTKTVVKCQEDDVYSEEVGLALCFAKKALGNKSNFNNVFKKWVPEKEEEPVVVGVDPFYIAGDVSKRVSEVLNTVRDAFNNKRGASADDIDQLVRAVCP